MSISNLVDSMKNMSLEKWDPLYWAAQACPVLNSPVDWKEAQEAHIFLVDLPGLSKDQVKVEVDQARILHISGDRAGGAMDGQDDDTWHHVERSRGKFSRSFRLPENVKVDEVNACMENGVLKVVVPKKEVKKPEIRVVCIDDK